MKAENGKPKAELASSSWSVVLGLWFVALREQYQAAFRFPLSAFTSSFVIRYFGFPPVPSP
jgi:hypothetical protein